MTETVQKGPPSNESTVSSEEQARSKQRDELLWPSSSPIQAEGLQLLQLQATRGRHKRQGKETIISLKEGYIRGTRVDKIGYGELGVAVISETCLSPSPEMSNPCKS